MRNFIVILAATLVSISIPAAAIDVTYNINTEENRTPISRYIYGTNSTGNSDYSIVRSGGNRLTAYNWENNYSNAGADWFFFNDDYMSSSTIPGKCITDFRDSCISHNQASIVTLQMAGYVSADKNHEVNLITETAPSVRFKRAVFTKIDAFCDPPGSPDTNDANVYMDEFVNFLVSRYGYSGDAQGIQFYCLDNEPDIWSSTHREVHPIATGCAEYKNLSVELALAIKNIDPNAKMLGPVSYGFNGYRVFQDAQDWGPPLSNGYGWFLDYYLDKMEANSVVAGKRLLDALDVHWYPEAQDGSGNRITNSVSTAAMYNARMQAPRTLWDYDYHEISWIEQWFSQWLPILPYLQDSIDNYYPDTNLAITEYAYGGESHYSGGIATADALGIFGKYGVYIACYWGGGTYVDAAVKIYTNYDGDNSAFGDTEVDATMSDKANSSIYASIAAIDETILHLIVINKNIDNAISGTFNIASPHHFVSGNVWKFDGSSSSVTATAPVGAITNNSFTYTIPAKTICHIVLLSDDTSLLTITKCKIKAGKKQYYIEGDFNDMKDAFEASGTAVFPVDLNDINFINLKITSLDDNDVIYEETIDFNASVEVTKNKFKYSYKVPKGQAGAMTSLLLNFSKNTFAIKARNLDLTGLACPLEVNLTMGSDELSGRADEAVVNGSKKSIPTRLMRLYEDTLIVTKAKVKNSTKPSYDSLSIRGDIAVADMDLDANEPNLVTNDVVMTFGDANDTNIQNFTIPAGSFKASKKGHTYKCSKVHPVITPVADANTLITASIDLDKCTFTISITKADLNTVSGDAKFGISFDAFNETDEFGL